MPRDRLAAMQKSAYMEDGDEFIPVEEDAEVMMTMMMTSPLSSSQNFHAFWILRYVNKSV